LCRFIYTGQCELVSKPKPAPAAPAATATAAAGTAKPEAKEAAVAAKDESKDGKEAKEDKEAKATPVAVAVADLPSALLVAADRCVALACKAAQQPTLLAVAASQVRSARPRRRVLGIGQIGHHR
jgi:hypothetical protein